MPRDWPWPEDTQLDIARAIAREALAAVRRLDPAIYGQLCAAAVEFRQGWVVPTQGECPPGERISYAEAEALIGRPASTIRNWANDPDIAVWRLYGGLDPQEVLGYAARLRRQRGRGSDQS